MTGNEQARSGHFCLCGYGAKAPLRLASQPHFWSRAASKFGKRHMRVWGRSAQQAEDCEAIPKKSDRWLIELARIRQLSAFSLPQTALCSRHKLNWRKLLVSVFKPVRQDGCRGRSPLPQSSRPRRPRTSLLPRPISVFQLSESPCPLSVIKFQNGFYDNRSVLPAACGRARG